MFYKNNFISALGLMSGTSMDGIDGSIISSDGTNIKEYKISNYTEYSTTTTTLLFKAFNNISNFMKDTDSKKELSYRVTIDHALAAEKLINKSNILPQIVGFHGQTIYHNPQKKITLQLGEGALLSKLLKTNVVSNFRDNDMLNGGEGAPLAPIYHKLLIENFNITLPACIVNIGGIANVTYFDGSELIGFDVGPGNGLMDSFINKKLRKKFDYNGITASQGKIDKSLIRQFCNYKFFSKPYPKSLDRNDFRDIQSVLDKSKISTENALATLVELTVKSIYISIKQLPYFPKNIIIVGGGAKNKFLLKRLENSFGKILKVSDKVGFISTNVEAEMIAYLAVRRLNSLPITFPKTTGVPKPLIGGVIHEFK
jgi:anhydro-N-acetylmuramic acid kinase